MNKLFALQNEKSWRTAFIDDIQILLINKRYDTMGDFMKGFDEKGILKQKATIVTSTITAMEHPESAPKQLTLTAASKRQMLQFTSEDDLNTVTAFLSKQNNLRPETTKISTFKAISPALLGLVLTAVFTFIIYEDALIIEGGDEVDTSGRRSIYRKLFAWAAEKLGSQGTLIAGGLFGAVCLYFIFKAFKNPPNKVLYQ
ncbi:MAG: hypothetical protein ABIX01_19765 [Chitinophagaceae bacterium]